MILLFLGEWRMTMVAVMTIPVAVMGTVACLYGLDQTINLMTLAGLALAIGPLVDSAIICLENTHRHLGLGANPVEAAYLGASEVALPELIATLCTLLVLASAGVDARARGVPVPPDVPFRRVCHGNRLRLIADVRPGSVCRVAKSRTVISRWNPIPKITSTATTTKTLPRRDGSAACSKSGRP